MSATCPACGTAAPWHADQCPTWKSILAEVSAPRPPIPCPTCNGEKVITVTHTGPRPRVMREVCPACYPRPTSNLDDAADLELARLRTENINLRVELVALKAQLAALTLPKRTA